MFGMERQNTKMRWTEWVNVAQKWGTALSAYFEESDIIADPVKDSVLPQH
jgi:hypothetical protein